MHQSADATMRETRETLFKCLRELQVVQPGSHKSKPRFRLIHTEALAGFALPICPFDEYILAKLNL